MTRRAFQRHPFDNELGTRLRTARVLAGLTQVELAARVRISRQHIQHWEQGHSRMTVSQLVDVCMALKVTPGSFFNPVKFPSVLAAVDRETVSLLAAFAEVRDQRQRTCVIELVKSLVPK